MASDNPVADLHGNRDLRTPAPMSFNCRCGANFESLYLLLHHIRELGHCGCNFKTFPDMKYLIRQAKERKL